MLRSAGARVQRPSDMPTAPFRGCEEGPLRRSADRRSHDLRLANTGTAASRIRLWRSDSPGRPVADRTDFSDANLDEHRQIPRGTRGLSRQLRAAAGFARLADCVLRGVGNARCPLGRRPRPKGRGPPRRTATSWTPFGCHASGERSDGSGVVRGRGSRASRDRR